MIIIISKEKMEEIIKNPLLDIHKGKYAVIDENQFICIDNSSGAVHQRVFQKIVDAAKWFNGLLT